MTRRHLTILTVTAALLLGACSGGDDAAPETVASTSSTTSTSTTVAPTTTTAPAPTTTVPGPTMPLTGLPVVDEEIVGRPAMVVKIDNHPLARPQAGLDTADLVYEENVESLTRFAAVFHSAGSDPVGPIRSGRTQDVDLLGSLNRPLFVWSGGNPAVTRAIQESDLINLSAASSQVYTAGGFFRSDRPGPHDLYASTTALWTLTPFGALPPPPQFQYLEAGQDPAGDPVGVLRVKMDNVDVRWSWDAGTGMFLRSQNGEDHTDDQGEPLGATNVVVLTVEYVPSSADRRSPEAQTIGGGEALVVTGGRVVRGTWERLDRTAPFTLRDEAGAPILLTPGNTWVELARAGTSSIES